MLVNTGKKYHDNFFDISPSSNQNKYSHALRNDGDTSGEMPR